MINLKIKQTDANKQVKNEKKMYWKTTCENKSRNSTVNKLMNNNDNKKWGKRNQIYD